MVTTALIIAAGAISLTGIVFLFVSKIVKESLEVSKLKTQKEILELEIKKQNNQIRLLEEEGKKYDKIINSSDNK